MIKLVCFDLDDTLIREIHSDMLLCILNGKEREHEIIQFMDKNGMLNCIALDSLRARLSAGLDEAAVSKRFLDVIEPLKNIAETVRELHFAGIKSIIVTVGPKQVAKAASDAWGFDGCYGSDYEVADGHFPGVIANHIDAGGKTECLKDYCSQFGILPDECVAVGDGVTDIPLFEYCGKSVAVNTSDHVSQKASFSISTLDLGDILQFIL